jgi:hypothetical protein
MHGGLAPREAAFVVVVFFGSQGPAKASQAAYYKQKGGYFV